MSENNHKIDRRDFLKIVGVGAAAALAGCSTNSGKPGGEASGDVPTDKMTYRTAPGKSEKVSLLGYGCMRWPELTKPLPDGNVVDQAAVNELVDYAIAHGVNLFDTSPSYMQGWSERTTGIALSRHPRSKYLVSTKLSNFDPSTWSREESLKMYHKSMEYLKVDYLDYILLHAIGLGGMDALKSRYLNNGVLDYLVEERAAGRIRNLGFSYHGEVEVFDYLLSKHDTYRWDFVLIQLNYVDWQHASGWNKNAEYLYGELEKRNIPTLVMEPLLGGRLSKLPDYLAARLKQHRPNDSVASWAFRYAGSFPKVLSVLSGMTFMEHLQDNIRAYSPLETLSKEEFDLLYDTAKLMIEYPLIPCTACQYCMPCPYGINIPAVFQHYNKCVCENSYPKSKQDEGYRSARRAFLVGYDRSVPKLRQASHCIGCSKCVSHCPQAIKIPQEMARIDAYVEKLKQNTL